MRRNLLPTVTVQADVVPGIESKTVNKQLAPAIAQVAAKLPADSSMEAGGAIEESAKGLSSIVAVFPLMIIFTAVLWAERIAKAGRHPYCNDFQW